MASVYLILETGHPLWVPVQNFLAGLDYKCTPMLNNNGDKALVQLKDGVEIPAWSVNNVATRDGVLWAGPLEQLYKQRAVDMQEWNTLQKGP